MRTMQCHLLATVLCLLAVPYSSFAVGILWGPSHGHSLRAFRMPTLTHRTEITSSLPDSHRTSAPEASLQQYGADDEQEREEEIPETSSHNYQMRPAPPTPPQDDQVRLAFPPPPHDPQVRPVTSAPTRVQKLKKKVQSWLRPKPTEYHGPFMLAAGKRAVLGAGDALLSLPVMTACGVAGGLVTGPACTLHCLAKGKILDTVEYTAISIARPSAGFQAGCVVTTAMLAAAVIDAARTLYHASAYPYALAYEAYVGPPTPERMRRYDGKLFRFLRSQQRLDKDFNELRNVVVQSLLGEQFAFKRPFVTLNGSGKVRPSPPNQPNF